MKRCSWAKLDNPLYVEYHDKEWGIPVYDDNKLFEMLILEGMQAGLKWESILNRRADFRIAFDNFIPEIIVRYSDDKLEGLLQNEKIIRNSFKIYASRGNAKVFLKIQKEFGSFSKYIWNFVDGTPIINHWDNDSDIPVSTEISKAISKDLKKRGMKFVGEIIIYAFMQAVGMVNDHTKYCFRYGK